MARTVSEEMSEVERRERLLKSCKAGADEDVFCVSSHVAHALDMDTAEALRVSDLTETQEILVTPGTDTKKLKRDGICQFNRAQLIKALEDKIKAEQ